MMIIHHGRATGRRAWVSEVLPWMRVNRIRASMLYVRGRARATVWSPDGQIGPMTRFVQTRFEIRGRA